MVTPITSAAFYDSFEAVFAAIRTDVPKLRRFSGRVPRWRHPLPGGSLSFAFVTSARAASLLPQMPGEFRLVVKWSLDAPGGPSDNEVSLFQYTSERDNAEYGAYQRRALQKFLQYPGNAARRDLFPYAADLAWLPRATDEEWCYYFDADDIYAWAEWYCHILPSWIERFVATPESRDAWTRRVMQSRHDGLSQRLRQPIGL
jgi:hypothetical protein